MEVRDGIFNYIEAATYLSTLYGHWVAITDVQRVNEQMARQVGTWGTYTQEMMAKGKTPADAASEALKPVTKSVDNVVYVQEWFKKRGINSENDTPDSGPNSSS